MPEISIQDFKSCHELITHLITLRLVLKDTVKTEKILGLEVKQLQQKIFVSISNVAFKRTFITI